MTDRELDARVAEKVMGLKVVAVDWPCGRDYECGHYEASSRIPPMIEMYDERGPVYSFNDWGWPPKENEEGDGSKSACVEPVPFYSTGIAAAWEIVARVRQYSESLDETQAEIWRQWTNELAGRANFNVHKLLLDLTPRTICLAALKAVGTSVE